jgi:hypothetical protein
MIQGAVILTAANVSMAQLPSVTSSALNGTARRYIQRQKMTNIIRDGDDLGKECNLMHTTTNGCQDQRVAFVNVVVRPPDRSRREEVGMSCQQ